MSKKFSFLSVGAVGGDFPEEGQHCTLTIEGYPSYAGIFHLIVSEKGRTVFSLKLDHKRHKCGFLVGWKENGNLEVNLCEKWLEYNGTVCVKRHFLNADEGYCWWCFWSKQKHLDSLEQGGHELMDGFCAGEVRVSADTIFRKKVYYRGFEFSIKQLDEKCIGEKGQQIVKKHYSWCCTRDSFLNGVVEPWMQTFLDAICIGEVKTSEDAV